MLQFYVGQNSSFNDYLSVSQQFFYQFIVAASTNYECDCWKTSVLIIFMDANLRKVHANWCTLTLYVPTQRGK